MMRRDPAGPGSRGGNWRADTVEDARDYGAEFPEVFGGLRVAGDLVVVSFTADLDAHLRGLQASVEHPELVRVEPAEYPRAKLEADVGEINRRLRDDPRRPLLGSGLGSVQLRAPFAELAAGLHREFGAALEITVGRKRYPPARIGDLQPVPVPTPTVTVPGLELTITFEDAVVRPGENLIGGVVFFNRGTDRLVGTTGVLTGGVRSEGDDFMAGTFAGAIIAIGYHLELDPGASTEVALTVGTASCLTDGSYVVAPGRYEVVAAVSFRQPDNPSTVRPRLVARGAWVTVDAHQTDQ